MKNRTVLADRFLFCFFYLVAAVGAIKTIGAEAHVALVGRVHAGGTMKAWIVGACLLCRSFAAASVKSRRAVARSICFTLHNK